MLLNKVLDVALFVSRRLPKGLRETGTELILKKELEIAGYNVAQQQPVIVTYAASNGEALVVQTGFIDLIVTDEYDSRVGIELKVAQSVTVAHQHQAAGYAETLGIPVVALAMTVNKNESCVMMP